MKHECFKRSVNELFIFFSIFGMKLANKGIWWLPCLFCSCNEFSCIKRWNKQIYTNLPLIHWFVYFKHRIKNLHYGFRQNKRTSPQILLCIYELYAEDADRKSSPLGSSWHFIIMVKAAEGTTETMKILSSCYPLPLLRKLIQFVRLRANSAHTNFEVTTKSKNMFKGIFVH